MEQRLINFKKCLKGLSNNVFYDVAKADNLFIKFSLSLVCSAIAPFLKTAIIGSIMEVGLIAGLGSIPYFIITKFMDATSSAGLVKNIQSFFPLASVIGLSGIIGYVIKDKLEKNAENKRRLRDEKEKQYKSFLNNLMGFFEAWKDDALQLQFLWDVYTNAPVYASDEVLRLAHSYIASYDKTKKMDDAKRQLIYARLVIAIRNELNHIIGEPESNLSEKEIKIMGLDTVKEDTKKQFLQNTHKEIKT